MGDVIGTSLSTILLYTGVEYATNIYASSLVVSSILAYSNQGIIMSSLQLNISSINGQLFGVAPTVVNVVSTANLANLVSTANLANLLSTANLANFVSTANLANLVSTANLANLVSTANLANFVSTSYLATQLSSTIRGITSTFVISSLVAQNINSVQGYVSSLVVDSLQLGSNTAYIYMGDVIATSLSTVYVAAGSLTTPRISAQQLFVSSIAINCNAPVYAMDINANFRVNSNSFLTGGATSYLSNSGLFSNAAAVTFASNLTLTGGATSYMSNSGLFSNVGLATFNSNVTIYENFTAIATPSTANSYSLLTLNIPTAGSATTLAPIISLVGGYGASIAGGITQSAGPVLSLGTIAGSGQPTIEGYRMTGTNSVFYGNVTVGTPGSNNTITIQTGGTITVPLGTGVGTLGTAPYLFLNTANNASYLGGDYVAIQPVGNITFYRDFFTGWPATFSSTVNISGRLSNSGVTLFNSTVTLTGGLTNYLSNSGLFSNAGTATFASNVLHTGGTSSYLSNSGSLSNAGLATFYSNVQITQTGASIAPYLSMSNYTYGSFFLGMAGGPGQYAFNTVAGDVILCASNAANTTERMFITNNSCNNLVLSNGYVGVNNISPTFPLDVAGGARVAGYGVAVKGTYADNLNSATSYGIGLPNYNVGGQASPPVAIQGYYGVVIQGGPGAGWNSATPTFTAVNGLVGINNSNPSYALDVNGVARAGMPVSSITATSAVFATSSYGIYYYITNSGFNSINISSSVTPFFGWFITLRNNTGNYLSITLTAGVTGIPASGFVIPPSNSTTIAYDTNGSTFIFF